MDWNKELMLKGDNENRSKEEMANLIVTNHILGRRVNSTCNENLNVLLKVDPKVKSCCNR